MPDDILINVEDLCRDYGPIQAVRNISFELRRGEVLGFLGPNGAGKSSTMQILGGSLAPTAGRVSIKQHDILDEPMSAKRAMGYLPEQPPLYTDLTVDEYLRYCAHLHHIERDQLKQALGRAKSRCGLNEVGKRLIANLSKGYQQRVGIAQAIIHTPDVVVLDEPTVGLDPIQIREIRKLIKEIGEEHSVLLSTHILPEVQSTCDRVIIINRGEIALSDSLANLDNAETSSVRVVLKDDNAADKLMSLDDVERVELLDNGYRLHGSIDTTRLADAIVKQGWGLVELVPERRTLEQIFVDITCNEVAA